MDYRNSQAYDYNDKSYASSEHLSSYPRSYYHRTPRTAADLSTYDSYPSYDGYANRLMPSNSQASWTSEPLSPFGSSDGSSQASSSPASPMDTVVYRSSGRGSARLSGETLVPGEFDLELRAGHHFAAVPTTSEGGSDARPRTDRDHQYCCLYQDCNSNPFKRRADLDRHYRHRHLTADKVEDFFCDYPRCPRWNDPFHRRDHFRDHLRDFHKEDIEKRGGSIKEEWLEGRYVSAKWWRCPRCLKRIHVDRYGYDCPSCKSSCQPKRKAARCRD